MKTNEELKARLDEATKNNEKLSHEELSSMVLNLESNIKNNPNSRLYTEEEKEQNKRVVNEIIASAISKNGSPDNINGKYLIEALSEYYNIDLTKY